MGNKPRIRFKGFTEDWEQRKLSELATMNARIGWQNLRTSEFLDSGDYLLITGTDFDNGRIKYGTCHYVEKKRFDQDTKIQLSTGSILITKDGTLGKVALVEELPKPATLNAGVFNVRVKDDAVLSYKYLYHYLKAPFLMKYVTANATGGTIKHLNQSILVDFPIPITEKLEQDRIAKLLDSLELSITLHQCKLEKLKLTKKALLQKLFPKNGKHIPEIRFKGFTDAWEQCKLSDVADVRDGTHDSPKFYNDGFPLVTSKNLKGGSIDFSDCSFISEQDFNEINKRSKVDPGDILFGMIGTIGNPAIVEHTGFAIKNVALIKEGNIINNRFIYHLLSSEVFENYIARENAGGTQKFIALNQIRNFDFLAPALVEQNKIIELLDCISQNITLHQRKLERLQELKKGLLQKMFV